MDSSAGCRSGPPVPPGRRMAQPGVPVHAIRGCQVLRGALGGVSALDVGVSVVVTLVVVTLVVVTLVVVTLMDMTLVVGTFVVAERVSIDVEIVEVDLRAGRVNDVGLLQNRRKSLAAVLEKANIVDTAGTKVDLNDLNINADALGYDEGADHEGHVHEGHDHEGHDHEGHDHEGHDHADADIEGTDPA